MKKNVIAYESNKYELRLDNFEGPLDALIYLIDKNKMNICDISIANITNQYLFLLKKQEEFNLEVASEFLVMASTLLLIKSKKLLPSNSGDDEAELTEEELLRRILEYKQYKDITRVFRKKIQVYSKRYFKQPDKVELKKLELDEEFSAEDLSKAYDRILKISENKKNENAQNIKKIAVYDNYSISDKVKEMIKELFKKDEFVFGNMYSLKQNPKEEVVTAFSGVLELDRRNKIKASQDTLFGDIVVSMNESFLDKKTNVELLDEKNLDNEINNELIYGNYEFDVIDNGTKPKDDDSE